METIDYLLDYEKYLKVSSFLWNIFRWIGWGIIFLFKVLLEGLEKISSNVFKLVDFLSYDGVKKFVNDNIFLAYAIGTVCLIVFFLRYMSNKNSSMKSLFNNLLLFVGVIILCLSLTSTITNKVFGVAKAINQENTTAAATILNENIYDITSIDANDWNGVEKVCHVSYKSSQYTFFDITKTIDPGKFEFSSDKSKEILSNRIDFDSQGKYKLVKLDTGMFTIEKEYYYRYSWNFWTIFFTLVMTIAVTLFTAFKYLQSLYNIGYNGVIMPFFAGSDFTSGSKIQKIMMSTLNIWVNVLLFSVSLKVYRLFIGYISEASIDNVSKLVFQLVLTVFLFEGPWIIQELTGIDGGIKSSVGQALALGGALFYGGKGAKALANKAKDAGGKVKHASKFLAGLADGVTDVEGLKKKMQLKDTKPTENQASPDIPTLSEEEKEAFAKEIKENQKDTQSDKDKTQLQDPLNHSNDEETTGVPNSSMTNDAPDLAIKNGDKTELEKDSNSPLEKAKSEDPAKEEIPKAEADIVRLAGNDTEIPDELKSIMAQRPIGDTDNSELKGNSVSLKDRVQATENANESFANVLKQGNHGKLTGQVKPELPSQSLKETLSSDPTRSSVGQSKGASSISLPNSVMQAKNQLKMEQQAGNVLSQTIPKDFIPGPNVRSSDTVGKEARSVLLSGQEQRQLKAVQPQAIAAKQTLGKAAMASSQLQRPSASRQALAGHILGVRPATRPSVQVPMTITQSAPVQALKQDIEKYSKPITDKTLQEVVSDKIVDRQIKKAEKQTPYVVTKQLGKNTGEMLRKEKESSSLRRLFRSSKRKKE